ncbi:hypothetical protein HanXRQr2_Chr13g0617331 [Helianthus annuus]|uniref:Uncharacterized protein n=1 Tax=Helianthus annuus TaxID=4232 RepID=A0A9K3ELN8_HELAN|nr:hypothetical protein HanXRQr2_Chr13g0617331 [Helianthus annuus]
MLNEEGRVDVGQVTLTTTRYLSGRNGERHVAMLRVSAFRRRTGGIWRSCNPSHIMRGGNGN